MKPFLLERTRIGVLDFGTGIIAGLAYQGCTSIPLAGLEKRVASAYPQFKQLAETLELKLDFHVSLHKVYGDSPTVRQAIAHPTSCGFAVFNDDRLYLNIRKADTETIFGSLPGTPELWITLAQNILDGK